MKTLILKTTSDGDATEAVIIPLKPAYLKYLLKALSVHKAGYGLDDVYALTLWDYTPTWVDGIRYALSENDEDTLDELDSGDLAVTEADLSGVEKVRMETPLLFVTSTGVYWQANEKHSGEAYETAELSADLLRELLEEAIAEVTA